MAEFDLLGFLEVRIPTNANIRPATGSTRVLAPKEKPPVYYEDGSVASQYGEDENVPTWGHSTYRDAYSPGVPTRHGAENLLTNRDREAARAAAMQNAASGMGAMPESSQVYVGLKHALQRGTLTTPSGYVAGEIAAEQEYYNNAYNAQLEEEYEQAAYEQQQQQQQQQQERGQYVPKDTQPPPSASDPGEWQQEPASDAGAGVGGGSPAQPQQTEFQRPRPRSPPESVAPSVASSAMSDGGPECDLCYNQDLIDMKNARLAQEKAEEMAAAREMMARDAAEAQAERERLAAEKRAAIEAAQESLKEVQAAKMARAREEAAELAYEAELLAAAQNANADQFNAVQTARREELLRGLDEQVALKQALAAQERAQELAAGETFQILPDYDESKQATERARYQASLKQQIEDKRAAQAAALAQERAEDEMREADADAQAANTVYDWQTHRAAQRKELEDEWRRAAEYKNQQAAAEAAREAAEAQAAEARARQEAEAERAKRAEEASKRAAQNAELQRQIEQKRAAAAAEAAYDRQFAYVPASQVIQNLIECRKCHRELPETRFRGSPVKVAKYKRRHGLA